MSQSSGNECLASVVLQIQAVVEQYCPQLQRHVDHWLAHYKDPSLLLLSLQREYAAGATTATSSGSGSCDADSSDGEAHGDEFSAAVALSLAEDVNDRKEDDDELSAAIALSLGEEVNDGKEGDDDDDELSAAIALSLAEGAERDVVLSATTANHGPRFIEPESKSADEDRAKDDELAEAIALSLKGLVQHGMSAALNSMAVTDAEQALPHEGDVVAAATPIAAASTELESKSADERLAIDIALSLKDLGQHGEAAASKNAIAPAPLASVDAEKRHPDGEAADAVLGAATPAVALVASSRNSFTRDKLYKVRLCRAWQHQGRCPRGDDCTFAHGEAERVFWQSTQQENVGSGWSSPEEAEAILNRLCGSWRDQKGSSYTVAIDGQGTIGVSTTRPSGETINTPSLIRIERHAEASRARIVWGRAGLYYIIDKFTDRALVWKSHFSTFQWEREALPQAAPEAAAHILDDRSVKRPRCSSVLMMRPVQIGFCHDTISPRFRDGRAILGTLLDLASGKTNLRDMPMMQIVLHGLGFFSVSNRRLCLYRLCELLGLISEVKVELLETYPPRFRQKFTTPCAGEWARVRCDGRICGRTLEETTFGREELFGQHLG